MNGTDDPTTITFAPAAREDLARVYDHERAAGTDASSSWALCTPGQFPAACEAVAVAVAHLTAPRARAEALGKLAAAERARADDTKIARCVAVDALVRVHGWPVTDIARATGRKRSRLDYDRRSVDPDQPIPDRIAAMTGEGMVELIVESCRGGAVAQSLFAAAAHHRDDAIVALAAEGLTNVELARVAHVFPERVARRDILDRVRAVRAGDPDPGRPVVTPAAA